MKNRLIGHIFSAMVLAILVIDTDDTVYIKT